MEWELLVRRKLEYRGASTRQDDRPLQLMRRRRVACMMRWDAVTLKMNVLLAEDSAAEPSRKRPTVCYHFLLGPQMYVLHKFENKKQALNTYDYHKFSGDSVTLVEISGKNKSKIAVVFSLNYYNFLTYYMIFPFIQKLHIPIGLVTDLP